MSTPRLYVGCILDVHSSIFLVGTQCHLPVPFSSHFPTFPVASMPILHHFPRCMDARTANVGSNLPSSSASDGNEPSSASDGSGQTASPAEWSEARRHQMTLGAPQGDPAVRQFMRIGREFYPKSALTNGRPTANDAFRLFLYLSPFCT